MWVVAQLACSASWKFPQVLYSFKENMLAPFCKNKLRASSREDFKIYEIQMAQLKIGCNSCLKLFQTIWDWICSWLSIKHAHSNCTQVADKVWSYEVQLTIGLDSHWPDVFQNISCSANCGLLSCKSFRNHMHCAQVAEKVLTRLTGCPRAKCFF